MKKTEFMYAFKVSKMVVFEVNYYTLGSNKKPYFSTSAAHFIRSKRDFDMCGQCQNDILTGAARRFYEKWDCCHCQDIDSDKYKELVKDIEDLKKKYLYIEKIRDSFSNSHSYEHISFNELKKLSMKNHQEVTA